jgi:asparagine synthetase B (glutamine-hydrolysing)
LPALLQRQQTWGKVLAQPALLTRLAALEQHYPTLKRYRGLGALPTYLPRVQQALLPRDPAVLRLMSFDGLVLSDALRQNLYGADLYQAWTRAQHKEKTYSAIIQKSWRADPADTAQALFINTWLTGNALLHTDKVTMAASLEARVPLFDPVMLKFAAHVPASVRMQSNKVVLRQALRPLLPTWAVERPKQPFSTPIQRWFEHELSDRIRTVLTDPNNLCHRLFQPAALNQLLHDHFWGRTRQVEVIFRLLTLELWAERFLQPG